jgi:hypothetical protein
MHPNPHPNLWIAKCLDPRQEIERGEARLDRVQVFSFRRAKYSEQPIAHLAMDDAAVVMHGSLHLCQRWCQPSD